MLSECGIAGHSSAVWTAGHNAKNKPVKILASGISVKIRSLHIKCTLLVQLPGGITSSLSAVAWNKCLLPPHSWKQIVSLPLLERIQNCGTGEGQKFGSMWHTRREWKSGFVHPREVTSACGFYWSSTTWRNTELHSDRCKDRKLQDSKFWQKLKINK